jgi:type VI secretion system (T6SS) effector Hcp
MTKSEEHGFTRHLYLAVLFWAFLAAASAAQGQDILYSVSTNMPWPKSTRADGKLVALSFTLGAQMETQSARASAQDVVLTIPVGEPVAPLLRAVLTSKVLQSVLIEFPSASQRAEPRAPFAVRLSNVVVTSVQVSKTSREGGPGIAEVKFMATSWEVFTATQDATGAMKPGPQVGWDFTKQKAF